MITVCSVYISIKDLRSTVNIQYSNLKFLICTEKVIITTKFIAEITIIYYICHKSFMSRQSQFVIIGFKTYKQ